MPHIIISYRRADSDAITGRIRDRLAAHFGDESIFMDVDSIPLGMDFREHIKKALAANDILIAVVGPKWVGQGRSGAARIMEGTDPVRIEVETAMKSGSVVIPVLVAGANMPDPSELPEGMRDFAYRNAADVDAGRDFNQHMERLIRSMDQILSAKYQSTPAVETVEPIVVPPAPRPTPRPAPQPPRRSEPVAPAALVSAASATPAAPVAKSPSRARWAIYPVAAVVTAALGGGGVYLFLKPPMTPPNVEQPKSVTQVDTNTQAAAVVRSGLTVAVDCKLSGPTVFADDFKTPDPAWVLTADISYHTEGQLALKALENKITRATYPSMRFKNPTICAKFRSPSPLASNDADSDGGVMFWATDTSNFYLASVYPNGTFSIYRMASDTWAQVVARTKFDGIKTGPGAVNEIQVATKDGAATMFINGQKALDFRGQPPKDPGIVGLYAASAKEERNEWRVLNVAVSDPDLQAPTARNAPAPNAGASCAPTRKAAFDDAFKAADPGWGVSTNTPASFRDNALVLKPVTGKAWEQLYPSLLFESATVCLQVKSPTQMKDINDTANAGVVFWGQDRSNYYTAAVFPNGQYGIYRMVGGAWSRIVPATKAAHIKAGFGAVNDVMVSFKGGIAAFFINGVKTFEFRGQPPKTGGTIGVFAGSEDTQETEWRFQRMVVVEND